MPNKASLDPRVNVFRPDLADVALKDSVRAERYVEPALHQCIRGVVPVYSEPGSDAGRITDLRYGEFVDVFETRMDGYAWVQNRSDRYVGYVRIEGTFAQTISALENRVTTLHTFIYKEPSLKACVLDRLTLGSFVSLNGEEGDFYPLASGGYIFKKHVAPKDEAQTADYVFTAGQLLNTPYLWGGRTSLGIDCSGLVQLALDMAGVDCPRDSDHQAAVFGRPLPCHWRDVAWKRGDLVFFKGHVGIMTDQTYMFHADAREMRVTTTPLAAMVEERGIDILSAGRPEALSSRGDAKLVCVP